MLLRRIRKGARNAAGSADLTWRYVLNFRSASDYLLHPPEISDEARRVADSLSRDGIAIVPADELLGPNSLRAPLVRAADRLERESASKLAALRDAYASGGAGAQKPYSIILEGKDAPAKGVYTAFALQPRVLQVVNRFFGAYSVLTHCQIWHNFVASGAPSQSQLWHRDPEDRHILKLFLYLTDVDDGAGPFTYARGSHRRPRQVAPHARIDGGTARSTDEEMAKLIPEERWLTARGARGSMVFADTRGYHKGGWGRSSERIVYVCQFLCGASAGIPTRDYELGRTAAPPFELAPEPAADGAAATLKTA